MGREKSWSVAGRCEKASQASAVWTPGWRPSVIIAAWSAVPRADVVIDCVSSEHDCFGRDGPGDRVLVVDLPEGGQFAHDLGDFGDVAVDGEPGVLVGRVRQGMPFADDQRPIAAQDRLDL